MTTADKTEIKEILSDHIGIVVTRQEGNMDMINFKLDSIQEQTSRTNGRVTKLELNVRDLQDENLRVLSVKKWMYSSITVMSIVVGILWIYFQFYNTMNI